MRVLIAFDKFKDSIAASQACIVASQAIAQVQPSWRVDCCSLTDGGEGFAQVLTQSAGGKLIRAEVTGPRGKKVAAFFGVAPVGSLTEGARTLMGLPASEAGGQVAIAEMASASGLALLDSNLRDPRYTSTAGTGELIRAAAAERPRAILLGVGGSATHDLGLGAIGNLGVTFETLSGVVLNPLVPSDWAILGRIRGDISPDLPPILIACDVKNPLLGPQGALAVYGPQKGLRPVDAEEMERQTARVASLLCDHFQRPPELVNEPGSGAAGGIAFGLMAASGALLLPGFELVSSWLNLEARIAQADLVITGEGRFDSSSMSGKGPGSVASRALLMGKEVHVFAGEVRIPREIPGLRAHAINPSDMDLSQALMRTPFHLCASICHTFS